MIEISSAIVGDAWTASVGVSIVAAGDDGDLLGHDDVRELHEVAQARRGVERGAARVEAAVAPREGAELAAEVGVVAEVRVIRAAAVVEQRLVAHDRAGHAPDARAPQLGDEIAHRDVVERWIAGADEDQVARKRPVGLQHGVRAGRTTVSSVVSGPSLRSADDVVSSFSFDAGARPGSRCASTGRGRCRGRPRTRRRVEPILRSRLSHDALRVESVIAWAPVGNAKTPTMSSATRRLIGRRG